jgi:NADH-ubiquinone oxidoreductase chain 3
MLSTVLFFLFIIILAIILFSLNIFLAPHTPYSDKNSAYESGFSSFLYQNRVQFNISFFLTAILFLIFDLEIILVYPYVVSAYNNSVYGLVIVLFFLTILTAGFVFEISKGALKINSRQSDNLSSISISPPSSSASSFASPKKNGFKKKLNLNQLRFYSNNKGNNSKPVKHYPNAEADKAQILKENAKKSGIYM